ncbi:MAG: polysaccharide pyruvyl transferase family protein [Bacteriovoracaceae bacterium]|jgi:polysaccharide pyruvyl transferase WcaK-like protein|nr:polysaccharide pyruvyl transferase family protein [Bacteriovoracaceae bacterium]
MNVLVVNESISDNLGDQLIHSSIMRELERISNIIQISTCGYSKGGRTYPEINVFPSKKKQKIPSLLKKIVPSKIKWVLKNFFRVLKKGKQKYDLVLIGGGQLILSNSSFAISMYFWTFILKLFGNKKIVLLSVGCGDRFSTLDKVLFQKALSRVDFIYVRDEMSQRQLKKFFNQDSKLVVDMAYLYEVEKKNLDDNDCIALGITDFEVYKRYNSIELTKEEYYESWLDLVHSSGVSINDVRLFYTTSRDREETISFSRYVSENYSLSLKIVETCTLDKLLEFIGQTKVVFSGRMHGLIAGVISNCKVVTYPISSKLREFERKKQEHLGMIPPVDETRNTLKEIVLGE